MNNLFGLCVYVLFGFVLGTVFTDYMSFDLNLTAWDSLWTYMWIILWPVMLFFTFTYYVVIAVVIGLAIWAVYSFFNR